MRGTVVSDEVARALDAEIGQVLFGTDSTQLRWHEQTIFDEAMRLYRCPRCGQKASDSGRWGPCGVLVPPYSSAVAAAWLVVEEMRRRGYGVFVYDDPDGAWRCEFVRRDGSYRSGVEVEAPTFPEATCRAALAALAGRGDGQPR